MGASTIASLGTRESRKLSYIEVVEILLLCMIFGFHRGLKLGPDLG